MSKITLRELEGLTRETARQLSKLGGQLETLPLNEAVLDTAVEALGLALGVLRTHAALARIANDDGRD